METKYNKEELAILLKKRCAEDPRYGLIAQRLREILWDSECNDITMRFYQRLQDEAIIHGPPVRRVLKAVASAAISADHPVRYFCASVSRRLREQGYLQEPEDLGL